MLTFALLMIGATCGFMLCWTLGFFLGWPATCKDLEITGLICDQLGGLYRYDEPDGKGGTAITYVTGEQAANEMHNRIHNRTNGAKFYDTDAEAIEDFCVLYDAWFEG